MTNYYQPFNPYAALGNGGGPTLLDSVASGSKMFNELAGQQAQRDFAGGDNSALRSMTAYQPENASKLAYAQTQQAAAQKQQMDNSAKLFEATYQAVASAKDPEAKKQAYETMLALNKTYGIEVPPLPDLQQYTPNTETTLATLRSVKAAQNAFKGNSQYAQMGNIRYQEYIDAGYDSMTAQRMASNDVATMPKEYYNAQTGPTVTQNAGLAPVMGPKGSSGTITGGPRSMMTPPEVTGHPLTPAGDQSLVPTAAIDQNEYMQMPPPKDMVGDASNVVPDPRPSVPELGSTPAPTTPTVAKKTQIENEMSDLTQKMEQAKTMPIREQSVAMSSLNAKKANLQSEYDKVQKKYDLITKQQGDYSEKVDKAGLGELVGSFTDLRNKIDGYAGKDIPGTGLTAGSPDWLLSNDGSDVRQSVFNVANSVIKARSGGAVTPQEADRLMTELGVYFSADDKGNLVPQISKMRKDSSLVSGIDKVGRQLKDKLSNLEGGVDKEALELYKTNGGTTTLEKLALPASEATHPIKDRIYSTPDGKLWEWDGSNMKAVK